MYSVKSGCIRVKRVVFRLSSCNPAKGVVIGRCCIFAKWLYSGKIGNNWAKAVVFCQSGCIRAKVVVFGQSGCIRAKEIVFGQSGCIRARFVAFGQKWLYLGKVVFIAIKAVVFGQSG